MTRRAAALAFAAAPLTFGKARVRLACQTELWRIPESNFDELLATVAKIKNLKYQGFETTFRNLHFGPVAENHARQLSSAGLKLVAVTMGYSSDDGSGVPADDVVDHI